ncbi:hypothetical protein [Streptomyces sp. NPDC055085]
MLEINLTLSRTKELLAKAVVLKGAGYVYTTLEGEQGNPDTQPVCFYVHGEEPGCIVGHALHMAGVPLGRLLEEERNDAGGVLRSLRADGRMRVSYEDGVAELLAGVQQDQDSGVPWGEAVTHALSPQSD